MGYQYAWQRPDSASRASDASRLAAVTTRLHCVVGNRPGDMTFGLKLRHCLPRREPNW